MKIELLDASGKEVLGTIAEVETSEKGEYHAPMWDGTNPKTGKKAIGEYQLRWTLGEESRMAPVKVLQGTAKKKEGGFASLQPGETIEIDFENALDKRWTVERAEVSDDQAHGGKKSLKVESMAMFKFGQFDDLPVKISMWVRDNGEKFGKKTTNGGAWGVTPASGDKFCIRHVWRGYLDGDNNYAWFNTGENQWFNPHPAGVRRKEGWREWVFDFTDPKNVKITVDGAAVKGLLPKFTPAGSTGLYFLKGDSEPLFVDDIKIEYPKVK